MLPLFPLSAGQHFIKGIGPLANSQDETLQVSSASVSAVRRTAFLYGKKVFKNRQARFRALLRMELTGKQISALYGGMHQCAVLRRGRYNSLILCLQIVGVDKIHIGILRDAAKQPARIGVFQGVPANMRNLQAGDVRKA